MVDFWTGFMRNMDACDSTIVVFIPFLLAAAAALCIVITLILLENKS